MTQENQFILSCYQHIADLNATRNIFIVQHKQTHKLYVMKVRKQYNKAVYLQLLQHHVPNTPGEYTDNYSDLDCSGIPAGQHELGARRVQTADGL